MCDDIIQFSLFALFSIWYQRYDPRRARARNFVEISRVARPPVREIRAGLGAYFQNNFNKTMKIESSFMDFGRG